MGLLVAALVVLFWPLASAEAAGKEDAWHPMEAWMGVYPFVEFTIEGRSGSALLDTGASLTVIDDEIAEAAGIRTRGRVTLRGSGGRQRGRRARGVALRLCGREVSGLDPVVLDLQDVADRFGRPLDAIIGGDIFGKVLLDLDYPGQRVALRLPGESPDLPELGIRRLPLGEVGKTRRSAALTLGVHGIVRLLVDTGAGGEASLYPRDASRLGLPAPGAPRSTRLGGGIGGNREQWLTLVEGVVFAGAPPRTIELRIPRSREGKRATAGTLGGGMLARYRVVFDLPRNELTLVGGEGTGPPPRDRLGLQAEWRRDALRVLHVSEGSPAELAGWRKGERIVTINGVRPASSTWRMLLHGAVSQPAGTRVVLQPGRGDPRESVLKDLADWST